MDSFTYITTCKGRLSHLRQTLPHVADQPNFECIVVDYGCPERCGDWVEANFRNVKVIRTGPTDGFNASHARNIGAAAAHTTWIGFFDADILLDPAFSTKVVPALKPGCFYRAHPVTYQTWGSLICTRDDFERIGGYDEVYTGWGGEDDDLIAFLSHQGLKQMGFPAGMLNEIPHSDEQRTEFCEIKDKWLQSQINQMYLAAKFDLFRLRGARLSSEEATGLFAVITGELSKTDNRTRSERTIHAVIPDSLQLSTPPKGGLCQISELQRTLSFTLRIKGAIPDLGIPPSDVECIAID